MCVFETETTQSAHLDGTVSVYIDENYPTPACILHTLYLVWLKELPTTLPTEGKTNLNIRGGYTLQSHFLSEHNPTHSNGKLTSQSQGQEVPR